MADLIRKNKNGTFDVYVQIQDGTEHDGNYKDLGEAVEAFRNAYHTLNACVPPLEEVLFYDYDEDRYDSNVAKALASWVESRRSMADQLQQVAKEILEQVATVESGEELDKAVTQNIEKAVTLAEYNELKDEVLYQQKMIEWIKDILTSPWSKLGSLANDNRRHPLPLHPRDEKRN